MKIFSPLSNFLLCFAIFYPVSLVHSQQEINAAAKYLPPVLTDSFNSEAKATPSTPKRGGKLRLRTPTDLQSLNILTATGAPEHVIINHLSDSLVDQDPATLEYYGEMAWSWEETDLLKLKKGDIQEGRLIEQTDTTVSFVPNAWKKSFNKVDLAEINSEQHFVVLKEQWGGEKIEGALKILPHTVQVDQAYHTDLTKGTITIPIEDLEVYDYAIGTYKEQRPFAKENTAFKFHLRPEVTWSDGAPFTGEDVKFSLETVLNTTVDCQHVRNYYQDVTKCEVSEEGKTILFHYGKTYFAALDFLGGVNGSNYFLPKHLFNPEQFGGDEKAFGDAFNRHDFSEHPIYTGPYKLKEWKRGDYLTITRNTTYWKNTLPENSIPWWNNDRPYMDEISWVLYQEAAAVVKDLQRNALDADLDVEPSNWVSQETNTEDFLKEMIRTDRLGFLYTYIGWNMEKEVFKDVNVRKALAMLIPREEISKNVHYGIAFPVNGPFFCEGPGYNKEVESIPYDPRKARRLLAKAGWLDRDKDGVIEKKVGDKFIPFEFSYSIHNARDYHQKIADIIKESVEQAGIRMTINKSDWTIFANSVRDKNYDAVRFAWGTAIEPDPFQIWHSSQIENKGDNFVSYSNPEVDELCLKIRETMDPEKRWEYARRAHQIIYEEQPYCFLFGFKENYYIDRQLRGVRLYPSQYPLDFTEWYWSSVPENRK